MKHSNKNDLKPEPSSSEPLLPYYVYVLLNPLENNEPFYVGKGTGNRLLQHNLEAERLRREADQKCLAEEITMSAKLEKINSIKDANLEPIGIIIGRYETEEEAFAVEATLIHFMFGYDNLTNVASGHGSKFIRTLAEFKKIKLEGVAPIKPGIDLEEDKGVRDNTFRDAKVQGLSESGAYELLALLKQSLSSNGFTWRDFHGTADRRFHPGESNGYLAIIVRIGHVDFNIQFTKALEISIQLIHTESTKLKVSKDELYKLCTKIGIKIGEPKKHGNYSWLEPRKKFKINLSDKSLMLSALIDELNKYRTAIEMTRETD